MPTQIFRITRAPEEPKLMSDEMKRLLWAYRPNSEWEIFEEEDTNQVANQATEADH